MKELKACELEQVSGGSIAFVLGIGIATYQILKAMGRI